MVASVMAWSAKILPFTNGWLAVMSGDRDEVLAADDNMGILSVGGRAVDLKRNRRRHPELEPNSPRRSAAVIAEPGRLGLSDYHRHERARHHDCRPGAGASALSLPTGILGLRAQAQSG